MAKYKKWKDKYEVLSELGEGGNAKVYHVKSKESNEVYALKELQVGGEEKHGRFVDEINIIKANSIEIEGIIPVLDYEDNCEFVKPKHDNKPDHGSDNEDSRKDGPNYPRNKFSHQNAQQQTNDEYKHFILL